jgi:hypothetical protein
VIESAERTVSYLSKVLSHGLKAEQAPPIGWRGHRTSQTRGYLVRPASVMREEARRSLRVKRAIYKGADAVTAELEVAAGAGAFKLARVESVPGALRYTDTGRLVPTGGRLLVADERNGVAK